jgi:hypothetical protein
MTIDILLDDVLLEIFDHYVTKADADGKYERWQRLVHVCQRWRHVVFESPLRLNLRILCSAWTPVKEKLAVWPQFPVIISQFPPSTALTSKCGEDNIIAALGQNNRVCQISLTIPGSLLGTVCSAMQKTFVALEDLELEVVHHHSDVALVVSDSFLGGSSPLLRRLSLTRIPFPLTVLRKLILAVPNLVMLSLYDIPHSAYISPKEMVTCLSALTRLNHLCIGFKSPLSHPLRGIRHPPSTLSVLPALTELTFNGVSEYLEDLVSRIDAPLLSNLNIGFLHQLLDTPQLVQFISRTPTLKAYDEAYVIFSNWYAAFVLSGRDNLGLQLETSCRQSDRQLSSLARVSTSSFPQAVIPMLEHFYILENEYLRPRWQDVKNTQWLELFHPFTTVKNLYISREFVPRIVPVLQELVGKRVNEVLPNLQSIFLEDLQESESVPESMRQFIAARRLSSRPIAISHWTRQDRWSRAWYKKFISAVIF